MNEMHFIILNYRRLHHRINGKKIGIEYIFHSYVVTHNNHEGHIDAENIQDEDLQDTINDQGETFLPFLTKIMNGKMSSET